MTSTTEIPENPPTTLAEWCVYYGLPEDAHLNSLLRHIMGNNAAVIGAKDLLIESLEQKNKHLRDTLDSVDRLHRQHLRELAELPCLGSANGCHEAKALVAGQASTTAEGS